MIFAYHAIITVYGFWLPNDPRGSWSECVRSWELYRNAGPATKTNTRRSVASASHNVADRVAAKQLLKYPTFEFTGMQARAVARGFARAVTDAEYRLLACAIMPDHVHVVIERDGRKAESIVAHLKRAASTVLREEGLHPFAVHARPNASPPSPWARGRWIVYLDSQRDVSRAIRYVNDNPIRDGLKSQRWRFIVAPRTV